MKKLIHIVDDEAFMRKNIIDALGENNFTFLESDSGNSALESIRSTRPDLLLLDINLPGLDGLSVLKEIKKTEPDLPVIIFTAHGTSERAIRAMKNGAFDYLEKPFELEEFMIIIDRAIEYGQLVAEVRQLRSEVSREIGVNTDEIVGHSEPMQAIFKLIGKVAPTDAQVLIEGESGTGKEVVANAIQRHSKRNNKPYIKVNCGALPENLLESEIFGHEKGAYTGAHSRVLGRFEIANSGTILLDEINNMPLALQIKLLRVLETGTFERLGSEESIYSDVRLITATNRNPEEEIAGGRLREDLFYRLYVVRIKLPPLRDRLEDIPLLVDHFVKKYSPDKEIIVRPETLNRMQDYKWPGNVRELENTIRSQIVLSHGNILFFNEKQDVSPNQVNQSTSADYDLDFKRQISDTERTLIIKALRRAQNNKALAARYLKINRRLLYSKISEYEIEV